MTKSFSPPYIVSACRLKLVQTSLDMFGDRVHTPKGDKTGAMHAHTVFQPNLFYVLPAQVYFLHLYFSTQIIIFIQLIVRKAHSLPPPLSPYS